MALTKRATKGSALTYQELDDNFTHLGGDGSYQFPATDGTNGYVLTTDGNGNISWSAGGGSIANLADFDATNLADGQYLQYDQTSGNWVGAPAVTSLNGLSDVAIVSPGAGQALIYDGGNTTWKNLFPFTLQPLAANSDIDIGSADHQGEINIGKTEGNLGTTINIGAGASNTSYTNLNIGTAATGVSTNTHIKIGPNSAAANSSCELQVGTLKVGVNSVSNPQVIIGGTATVGTYTIGRSINTETINIGTGNIGAARTKTVNIGTNASNTSIVNIAVGADPSQSNSVSTTTLYGNTVIDRTFTIKGVNANTWQMNVEPGVANNDLVISHDGAVMFRLRENGEFALGAGSSGIAQLDIVGPTWTSPSTISVAENQGPGAHIYTAAATDAGEGSDGSITYSVVPIINGSAIQIGTAGYDFEFDSNNPTHLLTRRNLDHETLSIEQQVTNGTISVTLRATDNAGNFTDMQLVISVTDATTEIRAIDDEFQFLHIANTQTGQSSPFWVDEIGFDFDNGSSSNLRRLYLRHVIPSVTPGAPSTTNTFENDIAIGAIQVLNEAKDQILYSFGPIRSPELYFWNHGLQNWSANGASANLIPSQASYLDDMSWDNIRDLNVWVTATATYGFWHVDTSGTPSGNTGPIYGINGAYAQGLFGNTPSASQYMLPTGNVGQYNFAEYIFREASGGGTGVTHANPVSYLRTKRWMNLPEKGFIRVAVYDRDASIGAWDKNRGELLAIGVEPNPSMDGTFYMWTENFTSGAYSGQSGFIANGDHEVSGGGGALSETTTTPSSITDGGTTGTITIGDSNDSWLIERIHTLKAGSVSNGPIKHVYMNLKNTATKPGTYEPSENAFKVTFTRNAGSGTETPGGFLWSHDAAYYDGQTSSSTNFQGGPNIQWVWHDDPETDNYHDGYHYANTETKMLVYDTISNPSYNPIKIEITNEVATNIEADWYSNFYIWPNLVNSSNTGYGFIHSANTANDGGQISRDPTYSSTTEGAIGGDSPRIVTAKIYRFYYDKLNGSAAGTGSGDFIIELSNMNNPSHGGVVPFQYEDFEITFYEGVSAVDGSGGTNVGTLTKSTSSAVSNQGQGLTITWDSTIVPSWLQDLFDSSNAPTTPIRVEVRNA